MKNIMVIMLVFFAVSVQAQSLSKSEKKALKKELKTYKKSPETYKAAKAKTAGTIKEQEAIIEDLSNQLSALRAEQEALNESVKKLMAQYEALLLKEENRGQVPMGTVYQVQLGFYEKLDLKTFNREGIMVKAEETGGAKRYVIGHFSDVQAAKNFNRDIQKLGVKDSFVSKYVDGVRDMTFDAMKMK